jgi:hypothetical protein
MSRHDIATLVRVRDEPEVRRARNRRRVGMAVLALLVLCGLVGVLGIRTATATATGGGYTLSVTHAQVTRAGIAVPYHVRVSRPGGFDGPLTLAISEDLLERFDFQNWYPNPSTETASGETVYYEFDPPPGELFELNLDARTAPDQNGSTAVYRTAVVVGGRPVAEVSFRMWVAP